MITGSPFIMAYFHASSVIETHPTYLGMDRNRFNAEVRGFITEIPIGVQDRVRST